MNFLYTAFSRATWSICIALLMYLCLEENNENESDNDHTSTYVCDNDDDDDDDDDDECVRSVSITNIVKSMLSYRLWTPIAHLSFGSYLIHPIVIYVWFLGGREKITFRIFSYAMDVCSITVVTFAASFIVTVLIEFPFGILLQRRQRPSISSLSSVTKHPPVEAQSNNINPNSHKNFNDTTEISSLLETQSYNNSNSSWQQQQQQQRRVVVDSSLSSSSMSYGSLQYQG